MVILMFGLVHRNPVNTIINSLEVLQRTSAKRYVESSLIDHARNDTVNEHSMLSQYARPHELGDLLRLRNVQGWLAAAMSPHMQPVYRESAESHQQHP